MPTTISAHGWLATVIDPATVAAGAMAVMRLESADPDSGRITECAAAALELVEGYLDRDDDPITAPAPQALYTGCVYATIEIYRRKDAPFGVLNSWSDSDIGPVRISTDWLKSVEHFLSPYRASFGVG
jgi:hypothetical protein